MKKLIKISILCFIGTILMSSCNSNFSITKRHYSNGYYVDNGKSKHTAPATKEHEQLLVEKTAKNEIVQQESKVSVMVNSASVRPENKVNAEGNGSISSKAISQEDQKKGSIGNSQFTKAPRSHVKNTFSELKKKGSLYHDGDGLSLFWIIILVILILWALGVISAGFAIGSIINLLLLVALILLILWLLRII